MIDQRFLTWTLTEDVPFFGLVRPELFEAEELVSWILALERGGFWFGGSKWVNTTYHGPV